MKLLLGMLIATLAMTSQASTNPNGKERYGKPIVTVAQLKIATRNVPARAKIPKPKLFIGNPHKLHINDWDDSFAEVDDVITSYRRRDLVKLEHSEELPEHIRWRLFLSRQLALLKYKEVHG